jgi:tetratricopeptide (TPR) repeat protein
MWFIIASSVALAGACWLWCVHIPTFVVVVLAVLTVAYILLTIKPSASIGTPLGQSMKLTRSRVLLVALVLFFNAYTFYTQCLTNEQAETATLLRESLKREAALQKTLEAMRGVRSSQVPSAEDRRLAKEITSRAAPVDRATALIALGKTEEATRILDAVVPRNASERKALYEARALAAVYSGNAPECVRWTREIVKMVPNDRDWLRVHALVCLTDGLVDEAMSTIQKELQITRGQMGPANRFTVEEVGLLAAVYTAKGQHEEALRIYRQMLYQLQAAVAPDDPNLVLSLVSAGQSCILLNRVAEAETLCKRARAVWGVRRWRANPDIYHRLVDVEGLIAEARGRNADAERCYRTEIAIGDDLAYPQGESMKAVGKLNLACLFTDSLGRHEDAEPLAREAYEIAVGLYSKDSPALIGVLELRSRIYKRLRRYSDAAEMEQRVREIRSFNRQGTTAAP